MAAALGVIAILLFALWILHGIMGWWSDHEQGQFSRRIEKAVQTAVELNELYRSQGKREAAKQLDSFLKVVADISGGKFCPFCGGPLKGETLRERWDVFPEELRARCRRCGEWVGVGQRAGGTWVLADPIPGDEQHATICERECPHCGRRLTLKAPSGTFYAECPNCHMSVYIGP